MKKISAVSLVVLSLVFGSCGGNSGNATKSADTTAAPTGGPDSAANNGILPPSASPGNANNSSLADTTYHSKDSAKKK